MTKATKAVDQTPAATPATVDTFSPAMKLERLKVREVVKAALNLPKEAITSREAGHIDIVVSPSMFATVLDLKGALYDACATNGIDCQIITESTGPKVIGLTFTNALMQRQVLWGARQHSRQSRVLEAAAQATPVVQPSEVKPEGKAVKVKKVKKATK